MRSRSHAWAKLPYVKNAGGMSRNVTQFLSDWLKAHVVGRVAGEEDVRWLAKRCEYDAIKLGLTKSEIELHVGPIDQCIREALK